MHFAAFGSALTLGPVKRSYTHVDYEHGNDQRGHRGGAISFAMAQEGDPAGNAAASGG